MQLTYGGYTITFQPQPYSEARYRAAVGEPDTRYVVTDKDGYVGDFPTLTATCKWIDRRTA